LWFGLSVFLFFFQSYISRVDNSKRGRAVGMNVIFTSRMGGNRDGFAVFVLHGDCEGININNVKDEIHAE